MLKNIQLSLVSILPCDESEFANQSDERVPSQKPHLELETRTDGNNHYNGK